MQFVKRKATTKSKITVPHFDALKEQYLLDIKVIVTMEEIPPDLVVNWDQTGINYVPVSQWTMEKRVPKELKLWEWEIKGRLQLHLLVACLVIFFLCSWCIGKTTKCLPSVTFPEDWNITFTINHWCNERTMLCYVEEIIIPYLQAKKRHLALPETHSSLLIFDEFNGQTTDAVLKLLQDNHIMYIIVPPNTTDRLQPMDLSVNKTAKEFLRSKFQNWYAAKISDQIKSKSLLPSGQPRSLDPIDLKLSIVKPLGARWMINLYDYLKSKPSIIIKGFKAAGIIDVLAQ